MATLREILINWTPPSGVSTSSVLYFSTGTLTGLQRGAIKDWLVGVNGVLSNQCSWSIANEGKEVDEATGQMVSVWTHGTSYSGVGSLPAEPVADVTQALVRHLTSTIINGRFVRGKTYIPGVAVTQLVDGNLSPTAAATINAGVGDIRGEGFRVWHRPVSGAGGVGVASTGSSVWDELAVLRRRRNK